MLRWLINWRLSAEEKRLGVPLEYARHLARVSLRVLFRVGKIPQVAEYRRQMPAGPFYAARIVAAQHDDCGECVQIAVNQASKAGLAPDLIRAALSGQW